jgi:hypothetical protein
MHNAEAVAKYIKDQLIAVLLASKVSSHKD